MRRLLDVQHQRHTHGLANEPTFCNTLSPEAGHRIFFLCPMNRDICQGVASDTGDTFMIKTDLDEEWFDKPGDIFQSVNSVPRSSAPKPHVLLVLIVLSRIDVV